MNSVFPDDRSFRQWRDFVERRTGVFFADNKRYLLESRIRSLAQRAGLTSAASYLAGIQASRADLRSLIDEVTTHETSFFRHDRHLDVLRSYLTMLLDEKRNRRENRLRVWCAACATGEETYSLGMLLCDLLPPSGWDLTVIGTDISVDQVRRARQGRYGARRLDALPPGFRERFMEPVAGDAWSPAPGVRRLVTFAAASLVDPHSCVRGVDVVLCRNVLIYFSDRKRAAVVERLRDALVPGGLLMLGPSDALIDVGVGLTRTPHTAYNLYRRGDDAAGARGPSPVSG